MRYRYQSGCRNFLSEATFSARSCSNGDWICRDWHPTEEHGMLQATGPRSFAGAGPRAVDDTIRGILRLWEICEPGRAGGFPILDRHLLRRTLHLGWHGSPASYQNQLKSALDALPLVPEGVDWLDFLSHKKLSVYHRLIEDASGSVLVGDPKHSREVLARATLLLRVATGALADLLRTAGSNIGIDLDFWLSSRSVARRLWPEASQRATSYDLWTDVEEALTSVEDWLENKSSGNGLDHHTLWMERSPGSGYPLDDGTSVPVGVVRMKYMGSKHCPATQRVKTPATYGSSPT